MNVKCSYISAGPLNTVRLKCLENLVNHMCFGGFYGVDYEDCSSCDMTTFLLVNDLLCFGMF